MRHEMDAAIDEAVKALQRARSSPSHCALDQLPAVVDLITAAMRAAAEQVEDHERVEGRPIRRSPAAAEPLLFAGGAA